MADAPRPPFDRLEAMTPPDQWADVAARLDTAPLVAGPVEVDARPTARRWTLAAAVAVLLAGAVGILIDRDGPSSTMAGQGESAAAGCPFTFLRSAGDLTLVAGPVPGSGSVGEAVQHLAPDDQVGFIEQEGAVEIDVMASGEGPRPEPALEQVGPTAWLDLHRPVGQPRPGCDLIRVRIDVSRFPRGVPGDDRSLEGLAGDFAHVADGVADVLALTPLDPELASDEPCSFTLEGDPALGPLAPMRAGDAEPYDAEPMDYVDDDVVTGGWQRVEVDGTLALVGVGGYGTGPIAGPVGHRWIDDGPSGSTEAGKVIMSGYLSVADSGWCTDAVVYLLIPLSEEQVAGMEDDPNGDSVDLAAARATIGRVLDAVRVEDASPAVGRPAPGPVPTGGAIGSQVDD